MKMDFCSFEGQETCWWKKSPLHAERFAPVHFQPKERICSRPFLRLNTDIIFSIAAMVSSVGVIVGVLIGVLAAVLLGTGVLFYFSKSRGRALAGQNGCSCVIFVLGPH